MDIEAILRLHGQEQALAYCQGISEAEKRELYGRLSAIDWQSLGRWKESAPAARGKISPIGGLSKEEIAAHASEYFALGAEAIRRGKVAAVCLAGGQGTRLGSSAPKGMYNIGVKKPLYLFEQLIRNLQDVVKAAGAVVPLCIMTSEKNDAVTRAFFKQHDYFGYPAEEVRFFVQEMAPCVDFEGNLLFEKRGKLALSPNGNGGFFSSLCRAGIDEELRARGVEWYNVFSVDNVLQRIADPVFVGATIASQKPCGAKVVRKSGPREKVGVLCLEDGKPSVVEYYELTDEMANLRDGGGNLTYSYGVILNYLFAAARLRAIASEKIPVHVVKKKIPHLDRAGNFVEPETENGYKFETLILDMVNLMGDCLPFEVERAREFAPVKNRTGTDSVDTARELLAANGVEL